MQAADLGGNGGSGMSEHQRENWNRQLWRSAYGKSPEPDGTEYLLLCSAGDFRAVTRRSEQRAGLWQGHLDDVAARDRGYERREADFICLFDGTVTADMDAHDKICTRQK